MRRLLALILTPVFLFTCGFSGCEVPIESGETVQMSLMWACVYKTGQGMQCPARAVSTVTGAVGRVTNSALGIRPNTVGAMVSGAIINGGASFFAPNAISLPVVCADKVGAGLCKLATKYSGQVTGAGVSVPLSIKGAVGAQSAKAKVTTKGRSLRPGRYKMVLVATVTNLSKKDDD